MAHTPLEEIDRPTITPDEMLIRVHAARLDRGAWHIMAGMPYLFRVMGPGVLKPKTPLLGSTWPARSWRWAQT